ncbi:efflux RND transporter periplasmic adaptor subunit [Aestuariivivens insulae]|uniref:efflux RND transporter periplasmic adaptor subunit n=1 Tax=Aestuariivivens insulae TaxID=1621988 RepID=UPI001F566911|nr:efflux RND transporter periplasmic adaptor subunit [Aestuariivivens insulae]
MQKTVYRFTVMFCLSLIIFSCGKGGHSHDGHSHDQKTEEKQEEHHDKVILTGQQFDALKMKVDTLTSRNMGDYVEANGTLEVPPQNEAAITTVVGANVVAIEVIEGDKVNKGQVVAYLSHPNIIKLQTDYLNAYSNSNLLKKDFERQEKLYKAGVGAGANFQKVEASYQASKAMVSGLAAQLKLLNVNVKTLQKGSVAQRIALLSPIEGFVQKVEVKTGQYVEPQTELFEIVNTHHVHADLMVFEKDVHKVKKGQKVTFKVQSMPDTELVAEIYSVGKTFEDNPKAVHLHAEIENKQGNLIPGMYIQGKIQVDNKKTMALPEKAIVDDGGKSYVFTVKKEGDKWAFKPVEVITGEKDSDWMAVTLMEGVPSKTKFAFNNAYYLMAEMKKGEAEHSH